MTWQYRVVRSDDGGHRIAEVYATPGGPPMWTADPIAPYGDSLDELRRDVLRMQRALEQPVLVEAELRARAAGRIEALEARVADLEARDRAWSDGYLAGATAARAALAAEGKGES